MARRLTLKRPARLRPQRPSPSTGAETPEGSPGRASESRAELVERLRAEVESGGYRPDPMQVAEALLREVIADRLASRS
jgi:anti-sigma-28 factor FlgM